MTAAENKAVFLSYASQDAEAALRICEALRAAGVEVWFDQNELVGGDAWDAKIRGQIAACALFVPVISAATQARREGYFRLEWKLAAQRTHAMAEGTPFLLPVVIDETRDTAALVPTEFKAVQWTRVAGGDTTEKFCAQVKRLLTPAETVPVAREGSRPAVLVSQRESWRRGVTLMGIMLGAALIGKFYWGDTVRIDAAPNGARVSPSESTVPMVTVPAPQAAPVSEARQLLARAWVQLNKQELARAELETADTLCKRAAELDPVDAEVWATWTHVHAWFIHHSLDGSAARREAVRDCAAKSIRLDPESFEARLAQAIYRTRGSGGGNRSETAQLLRDLLRERPDEPRCLLLLGRHLMAQKETHEEGLAALEQLARNPNFTALAWVEIGWTWHNREADMRRALEAAEKSIAAKPFWHNLGLKAQIAAGWLGDLELARTTAMKMSDAAQKEDWAATVIDRIHVYRRKPGDRIRFLTSLPQEWLSSAQYQGPKAALLGQARLMDGAKEPGKRDLVRAITLIDQRLLERPNDTRLLGLKALCQLGAGDEVAARANYAVFRQLEKRWWAGPVLDFESPETFLDLLEKVTGRNRPYWAMLELDPGFDPLRQHPRFIALLERTKNDHALSPHAAEIPAKGPR